MQIAHELRLLRPGVELDLIGLGQRQPGSFELLQVSDVEVTHADRTCLFLLIQRNKTSPLGEPLLARERSVDEVRIHLVEPESLEALLERADG